MDRRPQVLANQSPAKRRPNRHARRGEWSAPVAFASAALAVAVLALVFTLGRQFGRAEADARGATAGNLGPALKRVTYEELTVDRGELNQQAGNRQAPVPR